jgi:hypothetical protein
MEDFLINLALRLTNSKIGIYNKFLKALRVMIIKKIDKNNKRK